MEIEFLCKNKKESGIIFEDIKYAISSVGILASINIIDNEDYIMSKGVPKVPAMLINGKLIFFGKIPDREQLIEEFNKY